MTGLAYHEVILSAPTHEGVRDWTEVDKRDSRSKANGGRSNIPGCPDGVRRVQVSILFSTHKSLQLSSLQVAVDPGAISSVSKSIQR
jgi:hypothetical protein